MGFAASVRTKPLIVYGLESATQSEKQLFEGVTKKLGIETWMDASGNDADLRSVARPMIAMLGWTALEAEIQTLKWIRKTVPKSPIIVFGHDADPKARAVAFTCGVDNFVTSDCIEEEVVAKCMKLQSDTQARGSSSVEIGDLEIWPEHGAVMKNGKNLHLSERELGLLIFLANAHPETVSRQTLEREVFGARFDPGTNIVAVHIHRLRKKISAGGSLLRTVPGGYKLI